MKCVRVGRKKRSLTTWEVLDKCHTAPFLILACSTSKCRASIKFMGVTDRCADGVRFFVERTLTEVG